MTGWTFIILGATGDLARRKLLPALYQLVDPHDERVMICGVAREQITFATIWDQMAQEMEDVSSPRLSRIKDISWYQRMDLNDREQYHDLMQQIKHEEEKRQLPGKRIVYCAVPSGLFCSITHSLITSGIIDSGNESHRIVYEKPFGKDLETAREINRCIADCGMQETQIYRVDHYLTKEFIHNIVLLRFTNRLFEQTWHQEHIQRVEIYAKETLDVDDRGAYYDQYGAIRDMVQSHMLQMLALTAMQRPDTAVGRGMEEEKKRVLKNTRFAAGVRGQYQGYTQEHDVAADSMTETAAALAWYVDTPEWHGVPFYMLTGKELDEKLTEIRIIYEPSKHALFDEHVVCDADMLVIRIAPKSGFVLHVNSKKPDHIRETMPVTLDFCHSCQFAPYTRQAYEALMLSVASGEQSISVSKQEVEQQWQLIEQARVNDMPLHTYERGASGQQLMQALYHRISSQEE